jgi:chromosome segregation ATPase
MRLFYKKLYKIELENRKKYEKRYKEIKKFNEELQKSTGFAELNKKLNDTLQDLQDYKVSHTALAIELEDTQGFLRQERQAKEELLKQRTELKKQITALKKQLKEAKNGK